MVDAPQLSYIAKGYFRGIPIAIPLSVQHQVFEYMIQLSPHNRILAGSSRFFKNSTEPSCHREVLLSIGGRICACAVTGVPEERFHPGAEDPASDEAQWRNVA